MSTTELAIHSGPVDHQAPSVEIVVPVYNEAAELEDHILRLRRFLDTAFPFDATVTVADNASTDGTWEIASDLARRLPGVRAVHMAEKGRGRALRAAWLASEATVVAYMDVDLATGLDALLPLVAPLLSGHSDVAIGTRLARGARVVRGPKRELISRCYNLLVHAALHNGFTDAQCGFKALRADVARSLLPQVEDDTWFFDTELLVLAERNGLRIHEVPVDWVDDPDSRVDIRRTAIDDLKGIWRLMRGSAVGRPAWSLPARIGVAVLAALLYTWDLSRNGMGNTFYAAAVKSGTESWKAFLFGSLDPGSFITVDKPPASLWVMELSGRIFGFSSWSMLLPEAIAGVVTVLVLYHVVRRWAGEVAALLASLAMALTPIAVVMFRYNNPDAFLVLLLVLSGWALWSALETATTWKLVACGGLLGLAFTTKMLQAFVVLPVFGLVYLWAGPPKLGRRAVQLLWAGLALVVSSGWWVALVELWPKGSRPYVGGSTDDSELNLIFGYNGFGRLFGTSGRPGGGGSGGTGAPGFGGTPGVLRMFNDLVGGQVSWLIPLALVGLVAGLWCTRRSPRTDLARAGYVLWGGWTLCTMAVFSETQGIFHPYYTVALAPGVAALAGAGAVTLWQLGRRTRPLAWILPAVIVGSAVWAAVLLDRTPGYDPGLATAVVIGGAVAGVAVGLVLAGWARARWLAVPAGGLAVATLLAGPTAYAVTSIGQTASGGDVLAGPAITAAAVVGGPGGPGGRGGAGGAGGVASGPRAGARGGLPPGERPPGTLGDGPPGGIGEGTSRGPDARPPGGIGKGVPGKIGKGVPGGPPGAGAAGGGGASVDAKLLHYLEAHRDGAEYLLAVEGSQTAAPYILATGDPVMAMGGFTGSDPWPTLSAFEKLVAEGKVHYVLVSGAAGVGSGASPSVAPGGNATVSAVVQWVRRHGQAVSSSADGGSAAGTLYYVASSAARTG